MKYFKTVRGFLTRGKAEPDSLFFKYSAAIRIGGESLDFNTLEKQFKTIASRKHKAGESTRGTVFSDDMWLYESTIAISDDLPFEFHLNHLNELFLPHLEYLKYLKSNQCTIQLYLDYYTNLDIGGIEVPFNCLQLYFALEIPFGCGYNYIGPFT